MGEQATTGKAVRGSSSVVRHSFVLRIWRDEGRLAWKGWVQHAATGESLFVQNLDDLLAFIEQRTGALTDAAPRGKTLSENPLHALGDEG
jgi:hypothetical protein